MYTKIILIMLSPLKSNIAPTPVELCVPKHSQYGDNFC